MTDEEYVSTMTQKRTAMLEAALQCAMLLSSKEACDYWTMSKEDMCKLEDYRSKFEEYVNTEDK